MTTAELRNLLRAKYSETSHYLLIEEFRNATGFDSTRSADALMLSYYSSRGQDVTGFELKVSRADLLGELKNPDKSHDIAQYCTFWYLVLGERGLIKDGELPSGWGLMAPSKNGKKLDVIVPAPKLKFINPDRRFLMAVIQQAVLEHTRSTRKQFDPEVIAKQKHDEYCRGLEDGKVRNGIDVSLWKDRHDQLNQRVDEFQLASGIKIHRDSWEIGKIGYALSRLAKGDAEIGYTFEDLVRRIEREKETLTGLLAKITAASEDAKRLKEGVVQLKAQGASA